MKAPRVISLQSLTELLLAIVNCVQENGRCTVVVHPDDQGSVNCDPMLQKALVTLISQGVLEAQTSAYLYRGSAVVMAPSPSPDFTFTWKGPA